MSDKKPIGLIVGDTAELPLAFIQKHGIEVASFDVYFQEDEDRARARQGFYDKMKKGWHPKTSQPSPKEFVRVFHNALARFEQVIVILITAEHSGAVQAAKTTVKEYIKDQEKRIHVFDSRLASVGETLLVLKAQQLIDQGKPAPEILKSLDDFKDRVRLFGLLQDTKWLEEGGRITKLELLAVRAAQAAGFQAAITLKNGRVAKAGIGLKRTGKLRGPKQTPGLMVASVYGKLSGLPENGGIRPGETVAIGYADFPEKELQELKVGIKDLLGQVFTITEINPVIGTYAGPGALLVAHASL